MVRTNVTDGAFGGSETFGTMALPYVRVRVHECFTQKTETVLHQLTGECLSSYERRVNRDQQRLFWDALAAGLPLTIRKWQHASRE